MYLTFTLKHPQYLFFFNLISTLIGKSKVRKLFKREPIQSVRRLPLSCNFRIIPLPLTQFLDSDPKVLRH